MVMLVMMMAVVVMTVTVMITIMVIMTTPSPGGATTERVRWGVGVISTHLDLVSSGVYLWGKRNRGMRAGTANGFSEKQKRLPGMLSRHSP